jgi:outer membrane protein assembly factor BamB
LELPVNAFIRPKPRHIAKVASALVLLLGLAACSSSPKKPEPAPLSPFNARVAVRLVWNVSTGPVAPHLQPAVVAGSVFTANAQGQLSHWAADNGALRWRAEVGSALSAGVGSDGQTAAVVTVGNDLVAVADGRERWRTRLAARVMTPPLVAGQRVFVLAADRSVSAFDGATGRRLWTQVSRGVDPLVLDQAGVLLAVGDTLVAGIGGRLTGLQPNNGSVRWSVPLANPRGVNEIERLVDLVAGVGRVGDVVCARAFQAAVGCIDASQGTLAWARPANGAVGVHADAQRVYGAEANGRLQAWDRANGEPLWSTDQLRHRGLTAPLALGTSLAVGDAQGQVHLLSVTDGSLLNRLTTDGSPIRATPVLAGSTLIVHTRNGGLFAWRPE